MTEDNAQAGSHPGTQELVDCWTCRVWIFGFGHGYIEDLVNDSRMSYHSTICPVKVGADGNAGTVADDVTSVFPGPSFSACGDEVLQGLVHNNFVSGTCAAIPNDTAAPTNNLE